jgi:RNA polymerase sigma-70 factor (ECF subfamily)
MRVDPATRDAMLAFLPNLRAFALSLTNNPDLADDLVQDAVLRAWNSIDRFQEGTNLGAWLFTILRNTFYSHHRKRCREVEDIDGFYSGRVAVAPEQGSRLDFQDLQAALAQLSPKLREMILLVGAEGFSYEDVSRICGCPVGTVKSRVSRARERLAQLLSVEAPEEIGPDQITKATLQLAA